MKTPIQNPVLYTKTGIAYRQIYNPSSKKPMRVIVFASGGGGNMKAAIDTSLNAPSLIKVCLVVTDRLGIKAINIAKEYEIPVIAFDFEKECGVWSECKKDPKKAHTYQIAAKNFHNRTYQQIVEIEKSEKLPFDLVVLSYHRWIHDNLLEYFCERMINQHAGDLTLMCEDNPLSRRYTGINPVFIALRAGETRTRTSTFLVREGKDNGEILCQGPWVKYTGPTPVTKDSSWKHELTQKRESDWPSLRFALKGIALGEYGLAIDNYHKDGGKVVIFKERPLPYGGVDLEKYENEQK